jgi:hypothetical protein
MYTAADYLTSINAAWLGIVTIAALFVIGIITMIYLISIFIGREGMRVWAKVKIYEILLSFILIIVFLFISQLIFSINFQDLYTAAGVAPAACLAGTGTNWDLFSMALCNMQQFNQYILDLNRLIYYIALRLSFFPLIKFDATSLIESTTGIEGLGGAMTLAPPSTFDTFAGTALQFLYAAFVLSQVQMLFLASSLLFFSVLMAIGLIARMFNVTKSFGGAMIAFAIALGLLYPLLVGFTYGYINVQLDKYSFIFDVLATATALTDILLPLLAFIFVSSGGVPGLNGFLVPFMQFGANALIGLTIVPFLNFIILDVFIIDFSKAVKERMSFLSLLTSII